jgi:MFS family permease
MGTWMQTTAQGFLVYELTHSPEYLGYVGFAAGLPTWLLTLYGGVMADRFPRRGLLVFTQSFMMFLAFILAGLAFLGIVQPWHIIILALLLGVANSFDAPARQAFVSELVRREDLTNAIALNSMMFNMATAVGPAVAGVAYALFGPGWCFMLNGFSFLAVIVALLKMKLTARAGPPRRGSTIDELKEGLRYTVTHPIVRIIIAIIATSSLFALSFGTLAPAWAVTVLNGNAATNGLLYSARGVGSLIGSLLIASLGRTTLRGRLLIIGALVYPIFFVAVSFVRWVPLCLLLIVGAGIGMILVMNLANAIVQTLAPDSLRGRVMGAYTWIFFGAMPLGALWTGQVAGLLGAPAAVLINASLAFVFAVGVLFRFPALRKQ